MVLRSRLTPTKPTGSLTVIGGGTIRTGLMNWFECTPQIRSRCNAMEAILLQVRIFSRKSVFSRYTTITKTFDQMGLQVLTLAFICPSWFCSIIRGRRNICERLQKNGNISPCTDYREKPRRTNESQGQNIHYTICILYVMIAPMASHPDPILGVHLNQLVKPVRMVPPSAKPQ